MGKIYCLMGKSSSGKDTIYQGLLADKESKLQKIVPYTTRPIRAGETEGVEYHFVNESSLRDFLKQNIVIEQRSYYTIHGVWKYFMVNDGQINLKSQDYLIIGTPESYVSIQEYFGREKTVPILIELDDGIRLQRALNREMRQEQPKYTEMCRRFLADEEDFSKENIERCGEIARFYNDNLESCIQEIQNFIKKGQE